MLITIFIVVVLIFSAIFHEYAHGWVAYKLGDSTAKDMGRLTLNPLPHIDLFYTIIMPISLFILTKGGFVFGGAKPVPYNPYNLKDQKYGDLKVALGGPAVNVLLALSFGLLARFMPLATDLKQLLAVSFLNHNFDFLLTNIHGSVLGGIYLLSMIIVSTNLMLMIVNLIPIPPLDGSKVFLALMPYRWRHNYYKIESYGLAIFVLLFLLGFMNIIFYLINLIFILILGIN